MGDDETERDTVADERLRESVKIATVVAWGALLLSMLLIATIGWSFLSVLPTALGFGQAFSLFVDRKQIKEVGADASYLWLAAAACFVIAMLWCFAPIIQFALDS